MFFNPLRGKQTTKRIVNFRDGIKWIFDNQNSTSGLEDDCIAKFGESKGWKCFFAQFLAQYVDTPMFSLQSIYDEWNARNLLGTLTLEEYSEKTFDVLKNKIVDREGNGAFVTGCEETHCSEWNEIRVNGSITAFAIQKWWESDWENEISWFYEEGSTTCYNV